MIFAGGVCLVLAWLWNMEFPINKNLWTSSYVLLTGGLAMLILAWLVVVVDLRGHTRWTWPFAVYGSNALLVFVLTGLVGRLLVLIQVSRDGTPVALKSWIYERWFASWAGPLNGSLAFAIVFVLVWLAPMAWLYRRNLLLRI
jgi:predicted acyltransferase